MENLRDRVAHKLARFSKLENDWDGENGSAPEERDVTIAANVLESLPTRAVTTLKASLDSHGKISFNWGDERRKGAFTFSEGGVSFDITLDDGGTFRGEYVNNDKNFTEHLRKLVKAIF